MQITEDEQKNHASSKKNKMKVLMREIVNENKKGAKPPYNY